ncbi:MAG: head GIN domain-containing protein [Sphingopyxis sp.]|uniref:head GIN domain-containing protein n=1 Tax=Sphingopyxis sp. TaxID=1908224 RepID=UPI002ABCE8CE|nr:head GIN domain-containing protein [Sphingopyxis sp.]MDZ3833568.1 head GIN domain-containing protein [Sphingopyxis sp.]
MNSVFRHLIAASVALAVAPAAAAEKRFGLTSFDTIDVQADVIVEVTARAPVGAIADGPRDALDRLSIEARDGRLVIRESRFVGDERRTAPRGPVTIRVNAANLRAASLAGAGSLRIDRLKGARIRITLQGPGRLTVDAIDGDRLSVAMMGNGMMTLGGKAKRAEMMLSGAGAVDAGRLAVDALASESEGTGDHRFHAVKTATITARGIGTTVVLGRPVCTVRNVGSGTVTCGTAK